MDKGLFSHGSASIQQPPPPPQYQQQYYAQQPYLPQAPYQQYGPPPTHPPPTHPPPTLPPPTHPPPQSHPSYPAPTQAAPQPYPFSHLTTPSDPNKIILTFSNHKATDLLLAPNANPFNPLYSISYTRKKSAADLSPPKITLTFHPNQNTNSGTEPCTITVPPLATWTESTPAFISFPWDKWDCQFIGALNTPAQDWLSDVGTLEGHTLCWLYLGPYPSGGEGFVLRCHDVDNFYADVATVVMLGVPDRGCVTGRLEIDVRVVKDQNGLDELVGVSVAAWWMQRLLNGQIGDYGSSGGQSDSSSSSSEDESTTGQGVKKKKQSKAGRLFKKFS